MDDKTTRIELVFSFLGAVGYKAHIFLPWNSVLFYMNYGIQTHDKYMRIQF